MVSVVAAGFTVAFKAADFLLNLIDAAFSALLTTYMVQVTFFPLSVLAVSVTLPVFLPATSLPPLMVTTDLRDTLQVTLSVESEGVSDAFNTLLIAMLFPFTR